MKKKVLCWILAAMLILPSTVMAAEEEQTEGSGEQRKATIMVLSITGNEMTYIELDTDQEEESEAESEGMPEEEVPKEEEIEAESGAEDTAPGGGFGGGPGGGDMQEMLEALQENGGDMSQVQDMLESFAGGGERPDAGEDMPEGEEMEPESGAEETAPGGGFGGGPGGGDMQEMLEALQENGGDMSQLQDMIESVTGGNTPDAAEDLPEGEEMEPESDAEETAPGGGPGGGDMQDMLEALQENGGDMSQVQDMLESFAGGDMPQMDDASEGGGGFGGGPGGGNMQDMLEALQENGGDMSSVQDMLESFAGGDMPQMDNASEGGEGFGAMAGASTVYLQVGLTVHADGKEKTFSILEAGDELEVLFETDDDGNEIITEMWLLDTD